ncbi:MAG: choice-of-anchor J domain-containing protein [Desulfobacterales bacterium]|nr:choice-of-anchor J domain-containing protein [Desulfobacterales bacterium]
MKLSNLHKIRLNDKGSILVTLIITMVVLAALGAAMVSLTSTSMFGQVGANSSARAYFLAESGYRYAESRYLSASDRDTELENLHNAAAFTLLNNAGQFDLKIYPYYFKIIERPAIGTKTLKTKVPGGFPPGVIIGKPGWLKIGPKSTSIYRYDDVSVSGVNVTFTMKENINSYFPVGLDVLYAAESEMLQTVTKGGDFQAHDRTSGLPLRNGTIMINNHLYSYKENDVTNRKLIGIEDPSDPNMPDFSVADREMIVLQKFVKLHSTGIFGQEPVEGAASREVVYHVPLPSTAEERKEFKETFADLTNWKTSTLDNFALDMGRSALRVTGTDSLGGTLTGSLIKFEPSATNIDLAAAHLYGDPNFLSYDAQVKVGFDPNPPPVGGFDPSPIPKYFAAGLSFRLDNDNNSYGLSFLRGDNTDTTILDNLDNNIVPVDKKTLIVLWQGTGSGNTRKWLAYKDLNNFFADNMEGSLSGWTTPAPLKGSTNLWHRTTYRSKSSTNSWYYGKELTRNYDTGVTNSATLVSPDIKLYPTSSSVKLSYWTWIKTEPGGGVLYDQKHVEISTNGGVNWSGLEQVLIEDTFGVWQQRFIDLSAYKGLTIKIRFRFDSYDNALNYYEGWYIDDAKISAGDTSYPIFPINEATLMVRVKEVASVTFSNGGPVAIENLDTVVGQTSGARGVVAGTPIISSGSWPGNTAAGTLTMKNTTGTFVNEPIQVIGSSATATASGYRVRDNYIKAYIGDTSGYGTANNSPLDFNKRSILRGNVYWPPDEVADWSATNDYFTLVQWDVINSGLGQNVVKLIDSIDEPNAVIRSNTLTSPTSSPLLQPELGLHTFGKGSTNVYFDDFAVQADVGASSNNGFIRTIQE